MVILVLCSDEVILIAWRSGRPTGCREPMVQVGGSKWGGVLVGGVISSAATDMVWHYSDILDKIVPDICRIIDYLHEAFDNTLSNDFMHFRQHWVLCVCKIVPWFSVHGSPDRFHC